MTKKNMTKKQLEAKLEYSEKKVDALIHHCYIQQVRLDAMSKDWVDMTMLVEEQEDVMKGVMVH